MIFGTYSAPPGWSGEHQLHIPPMGSLNATPPGDMITTWDATAIRVTQWHTPSGLVIAAPR
jgi:hypothetical protein